MAQIGDYREAPYQGVSQAPPQVRRTDQAEALEDCMVAIPQGLTKRPPFTWLGKLAGHPGDTDGVFARVERAGGDALLTITREVSVTVPRVYDLETLAAQALTVEAAAQAYLNSSSVPSNGLGTLTVVDYTFLWSRIRRVENSPATAPTRPAEGMIWVRQAAYSRTVKVTVNPSGGTPVTVTLKTSSGATTGSAEWVDTDTLAASLISGTYTAVDGGTISGGLSALTSQGFTLSRIGGVVSLVRAAGDFTIDVEDGQGGAALIAVKDAVQRFSDLPQKAPDGFTVKISQTSGTGQDDYFVRYAETAGLGTGVWEETIAPGAALGLDPEDMPMGLVFDAGWKLKVLPWGQRTTGNEDLSPDPDFIGQAIQDLTFWRGRLAIVAGEGVTLSSADDPFRTYPRTLATLLDSDPLARVNPAPGVTLFTHAVPFESRLVLFGERVQCEVTAEGVLTPARANIDVMTTFEFSGTCPPQASNGKLYFLAPNGSASSTIYELKVDRITSVTDGEDLTTNAPRYFPRDLDRVATSAVNFLTVYGTSGERDLYVHLYRHAEAERVQNAPFRWWLPEGWELGGMFFRNTTLYVLACRDGEGHVLAMDLTADALDDHPEASILTHLDMRVTEADVAMTYSAEGDFTAATLPYPVASNLRVAARAPGGVGGYEVEEGELAPAPEGYVTGWANYDEDTVVLPGDWTNCPLWFGFASASRWDMSRLYALGEDNRPLRSGRVQVRKAVFDLADTGYCRVDVTAKGRGTRTYEFTGYKMDDPDSLLNKPPSGTTRFTVPIQSENEQVTISVINDSHFGFKVLGYEWRGEFNPRAQRA